MKNRLSAPRGMHDLVSPHSDIREQLEQTLIRIARNYGFAPIRTPLVEQLELFQRSVGESTDIVEKEMYVLKQEGSQTLALRPENTAGCVRAMLQHALPLPQKLYYLGPMFRYERPQSGRFRQFHQFGIEYFGGEAPVADCEALALCHTLWQELAITPRLEINFLGNRDERRAYTQALVDFFRQHIDQLDNDSRTRLDRNPLRVLDSKDSSTQAVVDQAPRIESYLQPQSLASFQAIQQGLTQLGIAFEVNHKLVRGLDYYNDLVFEWVSDDLGAQATVCAGGRYDQLCADLGGKATAGIGFALGMERLALILESKTRYAPSAAADAVLVWSNEGDAWEQLQLLIRLRAALPHMRVVSVTGSLHKQLSKANKLGAQVALICGEDERLSQMITVKYLREEKPQICVGVDTLATIFCH